MMTMYKWDSPALKQIWQKLYADNPYLFPYSSWEYNEQIYKYMKVKGTVNSFAQISSDILAEV